VPGRTAIVEGYCDGFVIGGGVRETVAAGISSAMANMPFFLQMVGTGLTTTLALHLGAVLTHAQWPAITCHELYSHPLITQRPDVVGGYARVPETPGLGVEIDEAAVAQYRVAQADLSLPRRLVKYSRANGVNVYFANNSHHTSQMWNYFALGNQPLFERGVMTDLVDDDGSPGFADLHAQAQTAPVLTRS
jgi:galactonate dehydratase